MTFKKVLKKSIKCSLSLKFSYTLTGLSNAWIESFGQVWQVWDLHFLDHFQRSHTCHTWPKDANIHALDSPIRDSMHTNFHGSSSSNSGDMSIWNVEKVITPLLASQFLKFLYQGVPIVRNYTFSEVKFLLNSFQCWAQFLNYVSKPK